MTFSFFHSSFVLLLFSKLLRVVLKCVALTFGLKEISTPSGHCDNNLRIISVDTQTTQSFGQRFLWFVPRNDEGILSLRNFTLGHISAPLVEL